MSHVTITRCRICGHRDFHSILHLGTQALTGIFPRLPDAPLPAGPVELIKCDEAAGGCGLVQLRQSYEPEAMYGHNYGYRSGLNQSMVQHLRYRVRKVCQLAGPEPGDLIIDIGSNDSTTLQSYGGDFNLVGIDPTGVKFARYYPSHIQLIPTFFNGQLVRERFPGRRAKIITSFAMFYDLESPQAFMRDIYDCLADDGLWVFEQSYLPAMLETLAYDTVCHEHLLYYALRQIKWMTDRNDLKIIDVELNDVNGGSFCVTAARRSSPYLENTPRLDELLAEEDRLGLSTLRPFDDFRHKVFEHRDELRSFVDGIWAAGQTVYGYGASTKGNVVLQFCNFTPSDLPAIAEVNEDKFGSFTPGTRIPIRSEAEIHGRNPDYLLVLPWHFRQPIIRREEAFLARGGKLLFPLPSIKVIARDKVPLAA